MLENSTIPLLTTNCRLMPNSCDRSRWDFGALRAPRRQKESASYKKLCETISRNTGLSIHHRDMDSCSSGVCEMGHQQDRSRRTVQPPHSTTLHDEWWSHIHETIVAYMLELLRQIHVDRQRYKKLPWGRETQLHNREVLLWTTGLHLGTSLQMVDGYMKFIFGFLYKYIYVYRKLSEWWAIIS